MGRQSKLTDAQWEQIGKRLLAGESPSALAREFGVSKSTISGRFSERVQNVKDAANQIVAAENALSKLNISEQIAARSLADDLKAISQHLAGAARFGAATAHRLSGIAHNKASEIDDGAPMSEESRNALGNIAVLTKMANEASEIGLNLLKANKDTIDDLNKRGVEEASPSNPARGTVFKIVRPA